MVVKQRILLVEDEFPIRAMLRYALEMVDFEIEEAEDIATARTMITQQQPDLILLDWMLPQQCGMSFTRELKSDKCTKDIPIILLTAKAEEENKVLGLESGADDYITKPFSPRELVARVRAVLRRGPMGPCAGVMSVGNLKIDTHNQRACIGSEQVKLGPLEYKLLCFFVKHPDRVFSRNEILTHVWGDHAFVDERTIDVHIRRLRKHLSPGGHDKLIQTVHGSGYRFTQEIYDDQLQTQ